MSCIREETVKGFPETSPCDGCDNHRGVLRTGSVSESRGPGARAFLVFVCDKGHETYTAYKEQYCPHVEEK